MNKTSQKGEKGRYTVILLLVVGLTAFSSAVKDLSNLQHFAVEASDLIAQVSGEFAPAEIPQVPQTTEIQQAAIHVASCELKQSAPSVELPWLSNVVRASDKAGEKKPPRAIVPRPTQIIDFRQDPPISEYQIAKLKKLPQIDFDRGQFEFRIADGAESQAFVFTETTHVRNRARKSREIRINPRDRETLLKTLNRSINLRFAS